MSAHLASQRGLLRATADSIADYVEGSISGEFRPAVASSIRRVENNPQDVAAAPTVTTECGASANLDVAADSSVPPSAKSESDSRASRTQRLVKQHFKLVWHLAQRLGLQPADAEDIAFRVLYIASSRGDELPSDCERPFLVKATRFVVAKWRRSRDRHPESLDDDLSECAGDDTSVDEAADQHRALEQLDRILAQLPEELRTVFVLFEVEGFSQSEIGVALGIPQGTAASRIRRAKKRFLNTAARLKLVPKGPTT